jgi:hypothetical protein
MLRAGNRLYPQSISDADGVVPPKNYRIVYFEATGTPDGGRNDLSLKNKFTVLIRRLLHRVALHWKPIRNLPFFIAIPKAENRCQHPRFLRSWI